MGPGLGLPLPGTSGGGPWGPSGALGPSVAVAAVTITVAAVAVTVAAVTITVIVVAVVTVAV